MRFGPALLTTVLLAAGTAVPCVAQENHSAASEAAAEHGASQPQADGVSRATHEESGAPASKNADTDAIDARVAPPSHARHDRAAHVRPVGVPSPRNLLARPQPVFGASTPTIRNTIGVAVQQGGGIAPHGSVLPLNFGRRAPSAAVKPIATNNGALNGTGLAHHNLAPAAIGGAAPVVGGINGSSIRPKHAARP
jgi:hypothetical protein